MRVGGLLEGGRDDAGWILLVLGGLLRDDLSVHNLLGVEGLVVVGYGELAGFALHHQLGDIQSHAGFFLNFLLDGFKAQVIEVVS